MFAVLIFIHEFGHMIAAKAMGVQVNEFAIGMGPALFKKQGKETLYSLRAIPIGGYCAMEGEEEASENPRAFINKVAWRKAVILVAGPFMNMLLALILMIFITYAMGAPTTTLGEVEQGSPALEAGLQAGDRLISVDGIAIEEWDDVSAAIGQAEEPFDVVVERDGETLTISCTTTEQEGRRIIGILPTREKSLALAFTEGPKATFSLTKEMYRVLKQLVTGEVSTENLSGPVGIVYMVNQSAKLGLLNFLYLVALISLNLGVINLLPFPALDGGRLLFVIIRKLTGKAITDRMEAMVNLAGMVCLLTFMLYITWQDILRFFF